MDKDHLEMMNRVIDRGVADKVLPPKIHAFWVGQRAKLDRMTGDKPLRKLLEDANDAIDRADAAC